MEKNSFNIKFDFKFKAKVGLFSLLRLVCKGKNGFCFKFTSLEFLETWQDKLSNESLLKKCTGFHRKEKTEMLLEKESFKLRGNSVS